MVLVSNSGVATFTNLAKELDSKTPSQETLHHDKAQSQIHPNAQSIDIVKKEDSFNDY